MQEKVHKAKTKQNWPTNNPDPNYCSQQASVSSANSENLCQMISYAIIYRWSQVRENEINYRILNYNR